MPRNGTGTFSLVSGNPVVTGTTIESNWANTTLSDIATAMTDSLSRSGSGGMTAALRLADGSQGAPGLGFASETGSGFYRAGTGEVWAVVQGAQTLNLDANGVYVPADKSTTVDGAFVFNEAGADKDARFEGDTDANLLFTDASTDRVGVGTNTPTSKLHVVGDVTVSGAVNAGSVNATTLDLTNLEVTNIKAKDGTAAATIADSTGVVNFAGNVGVGASTPTFGSGTGVEIERAGIATLRLENSSASNSFELYADSAANGINLRGRDSSPMNFWTGNTLNATLSASGNLGIGTSSPGAKLEVNVPGTTGTSSALRLSRGSGYGTTDFKQYYTSGTDYGLTIGNTVSDYLTLNLASGNLGLGVTPSAWRSGDRALDIGSTASLVDAQSANTRLYNNNFVATGGTNTYKITAAASYYDQGGGVHRWFTAPSGTAGNAISFTQAMTLDASGNLTLGQTSSALQSGGTGITLYGASNSELKFLNSSTGQNATDGTALLVTSLDFQINNREAGAILFGTSNTERARITSGGDVGIGNTNPLYRLTVDKDTTSALALFTNSNASAPNGAYIDFSASSPNNATQYFLYCEDSTAQRASIRSNGGFANYSGNDVNLSDRREKTNFAPAKSYLDTICAIPVQTFNYIDQSEDDPGLTLGVVAQDVQAVAPELVMESNWGTEEAPKQRLSIYQTDLQYALMKCIQELKAQNDELRARVAALESN